MSGESELSRCKWETYVNRIFKNHSGLGDSFHKWELMGQVTTFYK